MKKNICVFVLLSGLLISVSIIGGCARHLPVPGGDDKVNESFYGSKDELLRVVETLQPGMKKEDVFRYLDRTEDELTKLSRSDIMSSLYGGGDSSFAGTFNEKEYARNFLRSLHGYKMEYKVVERDHGFASPIRIRTHEQGFRYTVTLIFNDGILFDKPTISGGVVDSTSSKTIFDYINPSTVIDSVY